MAFSIESIVIHIVASIAMRLLAAIQRGSVISGPPACLPRSHSTSKQRRNGAARAKG